MPEESETWATITVKQAIPELGGVDPFFEAVAITYNLPLLIAFGSCSLRQFKEEQRPFMQTRHFKIYAARFAHTARTKFASLAMEIESKEVYQFKLKTKNS